MSRRRWGMGARARPERVPALCLLDLAGYTRLTEERGDQAAAALVESLVVLVRRLAGEHGGVPPSGWAMG
jgi:adenylate cyclase